MTHTPLLEVDNLHVQFHTDEGTIRAVDGISFTIHEGETFGLVGESGAGKSVAALSILDLIQTPPGEIGPGTIRYREDDLFTCSDARLREIRGGEIGMIFQDASTALNPSHTVGRQIAESVRIHQDAADTAAWARAVELLERVGIPDPNERADEYPHQFSGGMQQRVMIAMALANNPSMLIADEPTTALDVTIEATILDLLDDLQAEFNMAMLFISHDLSVISEVSDRLGVMYAGELVEVGTVSDIYRTPKHPYTRGLFASIPTAHEQINELTPVRGQMPAGHDRPTGCRFHPRCPAAMEICKTENPRLAARGQNERELACHLYPSPPTEGNPGDSATTDAAKMNAKTLDMGEILDD